MRVSDLRKEFLDECDKDFRKGLGGKVDYKGNFFVHCWGNTEVLECAKVLSEHKVYKDFAKKLRGNLSIKYYKGGENGNA